MLLAPHTYLFFPTRTIAQEISRVESSCSLWAASGAGSAAKPKMSKPQIILNAGCAAIAMAVAYRLANRALDSVLPKKKVEEEEPASARVLLDNGAEIGRADKDGRTPLVIACQEGNVAAARLWLACGAEIDRADKDGRTPLYIACQVGHVEGRGCCWTKARRLIGQRGGAQRRCSPPAFSATSTRCGCC